MTLFVFDGSIIIVLDTAPCYSHPQMTQEKNRENSCHVNMLQFSSSYRRHWKRGTLSPDLLQNMPQNSDQLHTVRPPRCENQTALRWTSWVMISQLATSPYQYFCPDTAMNLQVHNPLSFQPGWRSLCSDTSVRHGATHPLVGKVYTKNTALLQMAAACSSKFLFPSGLL